MTMTMTASIADAARGFERYVAAVVGRGERLVLTRDGVPVAEIRPVSPARTLGEIRDSLPPLEPGDADAFARDLEIAHEEMNRGPRRDPWDF